MRTPSRRHGASWPPAPQMLRRRGTPGAQSCFLRPTRPGRSSLWAAVTTTAIISPRGSTTAMPLASCHALVPIKAPGLVVCGGLDTLARRTAGGGRGQPPLALPFPLAQRVQDACPPACRPRRKDP